MNIAVINAKDLFKYIFKLLIILIIITVTIKILNIAKTFKKENIIENNIEKARNSISKYSFIDCLDISSSLFSYKKTEDIKNKIFSNEDILAMSTGIFDKSIFENSGLIIDESQLTIDDAEELENQVKEIPKDVSTEKVLKNNITPKVTSTYKGVEINNQSKYDITDEILNPNIEISNKKDILIYHTHTCESYTPSPRIRI